MLRKLLLSVLVLVVMGACGGGKGEWVAKIGEETITQGEFEKAFDLILKLNFTEGRAGSLKDNPEVRKQAIHELIAQKLILKEIESNPGIIKPEYKEIFKLRAISQFFVQNRVLSKIEVPSDDWVDAKYLEVKGKLDERGVKDPEQAKKLIVSEYQKVLYMKGLREEIEKLRQKYRIYKNDEFEEDGIKKYLQGELSPEQMNATWLIKIESEAHNAADFDKYVKVMLEISGGADGIKQFEKDAKMRQNMRTQFFEDYLAAILVLYDFKAQGELDKDELKNFIQVFTNNSETKLYLTKKIAPTVQEPTEAELRAFYEQRKEQIKKPYDQVRNYLKYQLFNEKGNEKVFRYIKKMSDERNIELNEEYFKDVKKETTEVEGDKQEKKEEPVK